MAVKKIVGFFFFLILLSPGLVSQTTVNQLSEVPEAFCLSEEEWKLYKMINEYRKQYDLPPIPISRSLSYVANTHVKDLFFHHPDVEPCNFHSWSNKGPWTPFCYPGDEDKKRSVWDKPKELTGYPGKGFEIIFWENSTVIIDSVIVFWKSYDYFNSFLMNTGKWQNKKWNAIGIGICQNFAAAWFGEAPDSTVVPYICGHQPPERKPDPETLRSGQPPLPASTSKHEEGVIGQSPNNEYYYIIIKSWLSISEAEKIVNQLITENYQQAKVLKDGEKVRVSLFETSNREEALRLLKQAKTRYKDAWLLKR
jgi:hypothetical protein